MRHAIHSFVTFTVLVYLTTLSLRGQHLPHSRQTGQDPPGTIDGAKTPDLIPEDAAWRIFIVSVAEPEHPTPHQLNRMMVKLNRVRLNSSDMGVLMRLLANFHKQFTAIRAETSAQGSRVSESRKLPERLFSTTRTELLTQLSIEGANLLQQHVLSLRAKIKAVPFPAMPN